MPSEEEADIKAPNYLIKWQQIVKVFFSPILFDENFDVSYGT